MKIEGTVEMKAPRGDVFRLLTDPDCLSAAVPGCEKLVPLGNDVYEMTVKIGVAAVKGSYKGKIQLADMLVPEEYRMAVEGSSGPGVVKGTGHIRLADAGSKTKVAYSGDVQVSGKIASVGNRFLGMIAKMLIDKFFDEMGKQLKTSNSEGGRREASTI